MLSLIPALALPPARPLVRGRRPDAEPDHPAGAARLRALVLARGLARAVAPGKEGRGPQVGVYFLFLCFVQPYFQYFVF